MALPSIKTNDSCRNESPARPPLPPAQLHTPHAIEEALGPDIVIAKAVIIPDTDGSAKELRDLLGDVFSKLKLDHWCEYLRAGETKNARMEAAKRLRKPPLNKRPLKTSSSGNHLSAFYTSTPSMNSSPSSHDVSDSDKSRTNYIPSSQSETTIFNSISPVLLDPAVVDSIEPGANRSVSINDKTSPCMKSCAHIDNTDSGLLPKNCMSSNDNVTHHLNNKPTEKSFSRFEKPERSQSENGTFTRKKKRDRNSISEELIVSSEPKSKVPRMSSSPGGKVSKQREVDSFPPKDDSKSSKTLSHKKMESDATMKPALSWEENFKMSILGYRNSNKLDKRAKRSQDTACHSSWTKDSTSFLKSSTSFHETPKLESNSNIATIFSQKVSLSEADVSIQNDASSSESAAEDKIPFWTGANLSNIPSSRSTSLKISKSEKDTESLEVEKSSSIEPKEIKNEVLKEIDLANTVQIDSFSTQSTLKQETQVIDMSPKDALITDVVKINAVKKDVSMEEITLKESPKKELSEKDFSKDKKPEKTRLEENGTPMTKILREETEDEMDFTSQRSEIRNKVVMAQPENVATSQMASHFDTSVDKTNSKTLKSTSNDATSTNDDEEELIVVDEIDPQASKDVIERLRAKLVAKTKDSADNSDTAWRGHPEDITTKNILLKNLSQEMKLDGDPSDDTMCKKGETQDIQSETDTLQETSYEGNTSQLNKATPKEDNLLVPSKRKRRKKASHKESKQRSRSLDLRPLQQERIVLKISRKSSMSNSVSSTSSDHHYVSSIQTTEDPTSETVTKDGSSADSGHSSLNGDQSHNHTDECQADNCHQDQRNKQKSHKRKKDRRSLTL